MIICITNYFDKLDSQGCYTGERELLIDFAFDAETLKQVVVPCLHPSCVGARFDKDLGEWVLN